MLTALRANQYLRITPSTWSTGRTNRHRHGLRSTVITAQMACRKTGQRGMASGPRGSKMKCKLPSSLIRLLSEKHLICAGMTSSSQHFQNKQTKLNSSPRTPSFRSTSSKHASSPPDYLLNPPKNDSHLPKRSLRVVKRQQRLVKWKRPQCWLCREMGCRWWSREKLRRGEAFSKSRVRGKDPSAESRGLEIN